MGIKLALIDDHELFRLGIRNIINGCEDMQLVKEYSEGVPAIKEFSKGSIDVFLIDITLDDESGMEVAKRIKEMDAEQKIIMLSMHKEEFYLIRSIQSNIEGYIHKDVDSQELLVAIRKVEKGNKYYSKEMSDILINKVYSKVHNVGDVPKLSARERDIVKLIVDGLLSKEISEVLSISHRTVETHRARILNKLGLRNTAELVRIAIEEKLV